MNAMWYALVQDEQLGPMDFDEVIDFYYKDIISSETLLWREGLSGWLPISHIQEFKELLFQGEFLSASKPSSGVSGVSDTRVFTEELGAEMRALSSAARPALPAAPALSAAPALRPPTALPAAPVLRAPPSLPSLPSLPARAPLPSAPPALSSAAPLTAPTHISARETDELQARREELEEELLSVDLDLEPEELDLHPAQPPYEPAPPLGDPLGDSLGAPRPMNLLLTPPPSVQAHQLRGEGSLDDSPSPYSAPSPTPPSPSSLTPAPRPLELRPAAPQRKSPLPWVALSLTGALGAAYGLGLFAPSVGVVTLDPPAATATSPSPSTLLPSPSTPSLPNPSLPAPALPDPALPDPALPDPSLPDPSSPKLDSLPAPQAGSLAAPLPLPATPPEVELPPPTGEAPAGGAEAGGASGEEEVDFEIEVEELAVTEAPQGGAPAAVARKKPGAPSANRRYKPKPTQKRRASKRSPKPPAAEPEKPPAAAPAGTCCTRDQVNRVVNASLGKIKACAEADAALKGSTVVVSITIMPSGKVENARATSSALRQSPQGGCVVQVVQGLKFPTFAGEPLPIQLPLKL